MKNPSPIEIAALLFVKHTHAELCDPDEIVYREKDVIKLLEILGHQAPDWDGLGKLSAEEINTINKTIHEKH